MNITNKILKNANITIVANKLHTSFLSSTLFDFLPNPRNLVQTPPFGLMDFGMYSFIVDVDNRRIVINHNSGNIYESPVSKMAQKFITDIKGPELIAIGFNYTIDATCDSEFGSYSIDEFLNKKYQNIFGSELSGVGIKAFIKKNQYNITMVVEPTISEPLHALINANFHYEMPYGINCENDFHMRYNELEEYINGIFG